MHPMAGLASVASPHGSHVLLKSVPLHVVDQKPKGLPFIVLLLSRYVAIAGTAFTRAVRAEIRA